MGPVGQIGWQIRDSHRPGACGSSYRIGADRHTIYRDGNGSRACNSRQIGKGAANRQRAAIGGVNNIVSRHRRQR